MALVGSEATRLVILRGDSASGKSTAALALREKLGPRSALLHYQFDVGLDETLRRHASRPLSVEFGEEKIREWYEGWQPFPWFNETRVGPEVTTNDLVSIILRDLDRDPPTVMPERVRSDLA